MTAHSKKPVQVTDEMKQDIYTSRLSAKQLAAKHDCTLNTIYVILRNRIKK